MSQAKAKWDRVRFKAYIEDWRPVKMPTPGPCWCSGEGDGYAVMVAYFPAGATDAVIQQYWPEATAIDRLQTNVDLEFSDRFPKPDWWKEQKD